MANDMILSASVRFPSLIFNLSHKLRHQIIIYRPFIANFVCYNMSLT